MAEGTLVRLKGLRRRVECRGRRQHGDRDQGVVLAADYHNAAVRCPGECEPLAAKRNSRSASSVSNVPEAAGPIARDRGEFGFFGWIPGHTLNAASMTSKLSAVFDLGFLGIPYAQCAVSRASGDEVTCGIPGYCADSAIC